MSSRLGGIHAAVAVPVGLYWHGQTVTHIPHGLAADAASVTGIWGEDAPEKRTEYGRETVRTGVLHVHQDVAVSVTDQWSIEGETWQTTRATNNAENGMKTCYLQRNDKRETKGKRGPLL